MASLDSGARALLRLPGNVAGHMTKGKAVWVFGVGHGGKCESTPGEAGSLHSVLAHVRMRRKSAVMSPSWVRYLILVCKYALCN